MPIETEMITVSSLEKIFPLSEIELTLTEATMLKDERFSFQIAVRPHERVLGASLEIMGDETNFCRIRRVDLAPAYQTEIEKTEGTIGKAATLYPEILVDDDCRDISLRGGMWTAFWITAEMLSVGKHSFTFCLRDAENEVIATTRFCLTVLPQNLSSQRVSYSNWMHYDCISNYYNKKPFTPGYYKILGKFFDNALSHGVTLLYTPLFTPPLDTQIGGERKTVQLVDVTEKDGKYSFNLDKLKRFVNFARRHGFECFEFSHFFSQWGAQCAPKIVDTEGNILFGWNDLADGEKYLNFLDAFLPELNTFILKNKLSGKCYYHISDEPGTGCIDRYEKLVAFVRPRLENAKLMDALSSYEFYERGRVDLPVVATSDVTPFLKNAEEFWVYYCCGQYKNGLSNRFFNFPSARNRSLGIQLYLSGVNGFLQWGYNFYNSYLSKRSVDPYRVTDGNGGFQAGDAFIVYPGDGCVVDSLRHEVFYEGLQDYRALKKLEELKGRNSVVAMLNEFGIKAGFENAVCDGETLIRLREKINAAIVA